MQAYQGERELESQHGYWASESMLGNSLLLGRMKVLRTKIQIYCPQGYGLKNTSWTFITAGKVALYECKTILRDVTPHQSCLCSQWVLIPVARTLLGTWVVQELCEPTHSDSLSSICLIKWENASGSFLESSCLTQILYFLCSKDSRVTSSLQTFSKPSSP